MNNRKKKDTQRVPIARAKEVAERHGLDQVILLGWSRTTGLTHVVTYGRTLEDCAQAAEGGNRMKRVMGWPEALCQERPARLTRGGKKP